MKFKRKLFIPIGVGAKEPLSPPLSPLGGAREKNTESSGNRIVIKFCFVTVLGAGALGVFGAEAGTNGAPEEALSLDYVVGAVLSNNPSLKAAEENWGAMRERVPQSGAWEDARLSFDTRAARFVGVPANSFADQRLGVEQTLPISARRRHRGDAATADAGLAMEEMRRRQLDAVARARTEYFDLANAYKQLELNRKNSALLRQFAEISRAKMATGDRSEAEVLSADTELARLDEAQYDFQRDISEAQTALNVLMNRPPETPLGKPGEMTFKPVELSLGDLEGMALAQRPEVAAAQRKLEAAQARLEGARQAWIPEPALRVEGDRYNAASQVVSELDVGFSIDLPWFNRAKYRAGIAENRRLVGAAEHDLEAARSETLGLVADQFRRVETFHHHTMLYQAKLLPLARETVEAQKSGYESSKGSFLEVLTAQATARDVESMYWDHLMHYQQALAELEAMIGSDLPSGPQTNSAAAHHHND